MISTPDTRTEMSRAVAMDAAWRPPAPYEIEHRCEAAAANGGRPAQGERSALVLEVEFRRFPSLLSLIFFPELEWPAKSGTDLKQKLGSCRTKPSEPGMIPTNQKCARPRPRVPAPRLPLLWHGCLPLLRAVGFRGRIGPRWPAESRHHTCLALLGCVHSTARGREFRRV